MAAPLSRRSVWSLLLLLFLVVPCAVEAEQEVQAPGEEEVKGLASATVVVALRAGPQCAPWVAEALAQNIERELDGYKRLKVSAKKLALRDTCANSKSCLLRTLSQSSVDIVLQGTVEPTKLRYALYETWTPALIETGTISVGFGSTLIDLKQQTLRAFHPILSSGGLLDQAPYMRNDRGTNTGEGSSRTAQRVTSFLPSVLGVVALMLLFPFVLSQFLIKGPRLRRSLRLPTVWFAALLLSLLALIEVVILFGHSIDLGSALHSPWKWVIGLVSGCSWGFLLLDGLRFAFAPLSGIERVGHRDVFRLVKDWFFASLQRLFGVALFYSPLVFCLVHGCRVLAVTTTETLLIVGPVAGLLYRFWIALLRECLTLVIDDLLILDEASEKNHWHSETRRYFLGYIKRTGWNLDERLLNDTLFLPARRDGVYSYGGGLIKNRIAVGEETLLLSMGEIEDAPQEERRIEFPQWSEGIVTIQDSSEHQESKKRPRQSEGGLELDTTLSIIRRITLRKQKLRRRPLGQAATLLGYVVPTPPDELIPLIVDDSVDWGVVRELLAEHYAWFESDPYEEDDDSDPTDRDFLFGVLAREIGALERRDHQLATLFLPGDLWLWKKLPIIHRIWLWCRNLIQILLGRLPTIVADAYAALHYARDHMVQYLYFLEKGKRDSLTTRADPETLERHTRKLLRNVAHWSPKWHERWFFAPSTRNRLMWLSRLTDHPFGKKSEKRLKILFVTAIAAAVVGVSGLAVKQAIDYHPVYEDRIRQQEERIREIERENNEINKQRPGTYDTSTDQRRREISDRE